MTSAFANPLVTLYQGDALDILAQLPAESIHCIVTSPPYWRLRCYSGEQERIWDAVGGCVHEWEYQHGASRGHADTRSTLAGTQTAHLSKAAGSQGAFCRHCGGWRGSLGREPGVELYIQHLMQVMVALWRVLRDDGVCWVNLDDTRQGDSTQRVKDMALVPERFIIAAQALGWVVRSKVVWALPNTMPESATDRPTDAYQMLYCLTKTNQPQFWIHRDLPGVRRQPKPDYRWQRVQGIPDDPAWHDSSFSGIHDLELYDDVSEQPRNVEVLEERTTPPPGWTPKSKGDWRRLNLWRGHSVWWDQEPIRVPSPLSMSSDAYQSARERERNHHWYADFQTDPGRTKREQLYGPTSAAPPTGRNARNVQAWPTGHLGSFRINGKELTHFAAFPRALPDWCIRASCPATCCGRCGAGCYRVVEKQLSPHDGITKTAYDTRRDSAGRLALLREASRERGSEYSNQVQTLGWSPTCSCPQDVPRVAGLVLDPFLGSGTTALAAQELGRRCIGIDLSADYIALAWHRLQQQQPALVMP